MANRLVLLYTLFFAVTVHLADANYCDGQYTTNEEDVITGIDIDVEWGTVTPYARIVLQNILPIDGRFQNVCRHNLDQKLSVCIKVLQHKLKEFRPTSFTVDSRESDCQCQPVKFTGRINKTRIFKQPMYTCPTTTVKYTREDDYERSEEEPPFLLGPAYHKTEIRVRFTDGRLTENPISILGQLTSFDKKALNFKKFRTGHYTYKPDYSDSDASGSGPTESMDDYGSDLREPLLRNYSK